MTLVLARTDQRGNAVVATDTRVTEKTFEREKIGFFDADLLDPPRPKVWLEPRGWCVTAGLDVREARRALQEAGAGDMSVLAQVVRETIPERLFPHSAIIVVPRVGELRAVMDAGSRMGGGLFWAGQPAGLSEAQKAGWGGWLQTVPDPATDLFGLIQWCATLHHRLYGMLGEEGSISPRAEFGIFQRGEARYIPPTPVARIARSSDGEIGNMLQPPPASLENEAPERPVVHHTSIDGGELIRVRDPVNSRFVAGEDVFDKTNDDLDEVPDGSNFARVLLADTNSNRIKKLPADTEAEGDIYVADTGAPQVGTVASPSSLTKTLMIAYLDLLPETEGDKWRVGSGDGRHIQPNAVSDQLDLFGRAVLPRGVTITAIRARLDRNATGDTAILFFGRRGRTTDGSAVTNLATLTHATTGWATLSDTSVSETVSDDVYLVHVRLNSTNAIGDAKFGWCEIDYTMPSYDKGY